MAAPMGWVTFSKKPPTVQEIADQVKEITGLDVHIETVEGSDEQSIAFKAIPEEKLDLSWGTLRDIPGNSEVLRLDYAIAGGTLLFATRVALESMGGLLGGAFVRHDPHKLRQKHRK